jgi:hypothetical protein
MSIISRFIDDTILPFTFKVSDQPMLYKELLQANKLYDDGMKLEGKIPGMRIRVGRAILVFAIFWHLVFILPGVALIHLLLPYIDCHVAIILAVIFTALFFSVYFVFKEWLVDRMAQKRIRAAWKNQFPHFDYDTHHAEVTRLYSKALENEVPTKDLRLYILNHLVTE